jgi:arylsulfatase A-like enzyme
MLNRRELLLKGATVAAGTVALGRAPIAWAQDPPVAGMNIVLFISDQERAIQHFPRGWSRRHLPGFTRLQRRGLTFENAFCATAMCSPTRATMFTGYFPAQHGVKYTLEEDMDKAKWPQVELSPHFKNLGTVIGAAGYNVVYKGKWHLSKPAGTDWAPSDLAKYGFSRWSPPDAGANQDIDQEGGGKTDNDGNYMHQVGTAEAGTEGVLQYLNTAAAKQQPCFLGRLADQPARRAAVPEELRRRRVRQFVVDR